MGNKKLQKSATNGLFFREMIEKLFEKRSEEDMVQFAGLARRIWLKRNEVVFGGTLLSPITLFWRTQQAINEFQTAQVKSEVAIQITEDQNPVLWKHGNCMGSTRPYG
jgi:hypothetical protein